MKDQGHGSHWETVLGEESIVAKLKEIVQNSGILSKKRAAVVLDDGVEEKDLLTLMCPVSESQIPINFMTILAEQDGRSALVSGYPFSIEGALLKGRITDIEIWDNNVEAVVTMEFGEDREISFFATDYHFNKEKYQPGKYCEVRLAAFAYECKIHDTRELSFQLDGDKAKSFRSNLGEDIRNELGVKENDESPIQFDASEMTLLLPISDDYKDDYKFLSPVQSVSTFEILGVRMLELGIFVDEGLGGDRIALPLFVRESMFDGQDNPKPQAGQSVGGAFWLQGYLDKRYEGLERVEPDRDADSARNTEPYPDFLSARMSETLNESWKKFREVTSVRDSFDNEQACRAFADIIMEHAPEDTGFFVRTNVLPKCSAGRKKVDIVCGFEAAGEVLYSCAILLKSIQDNNAFTSKMFRIYKDLHFLESILDAYSDGCGYSECRFYMVTGAEEFRTVAAYRTKSEDFPEFGLNGQTTARYVRYHDARESGERQELVFRKEYDISWEPRAGASDRHFLEIDINDKVVDCIIGVFRFLDKERISYMHDIIDKSEYDALISRYPDRKFEAAFRLSETPFDNAENQSWTMSNGKILYASDIKVSKSAYSVICDVLYDFLVINAQEMGSKILRVKMEDRKLIKYFSEADDYLMVGKVKTGIVGKVKAAYFEVDAKTFE